MRERVICNSDALSRKFIVKEKTVNFIFSGVLLLVLGHTLMNLIFLFTRGWNKFRSAQFLLRPEKKL